jgi:hypothetical protein
MFWILVQKSSKSYGIVSTKFLRSIGAVAYASQSSL